MNQNELYDEIPHELKECGRVQIKNIFRDAGYVVFRDHVVDHTGYYIFKEVFTKNDIINPIRYKYLGWYKLLKQVMYEIKNDYMDSCRHFEVNVTSVLEVYDNEVS